MASLVVQESVAFSFRKSARNPFAGERFQVKLHLEASDLNMRMSLPSGS